MAMASDSHRTSKASYLWDHGMINLCIKVTFVGMKKKSTFWLRVSESSNIRDLMDHLKASKGISGKLIGKRLSYRMTLAEAGIVADSTVMMESFTPPKRFTRATQVKVKLPSGEVISVQIHKGTTIAELKHKIQDVIGIPAEKQVLEYASRPVRLVNKLVTDMYTHMKTPFVLKSRGKF